MITDIFFGIAGSILYIFAYPFSFITYITPHQVTDSIAYFVPYILYWRGVLPIDTILQITQALLNFFVVYYGLKIVLWAFAHIPWIGARHSNPTVSHDKGK